MTNTPGEVPQHALVDFTKRLHGNLDRLVDVPAWSMTAQEQRTVLVDLARAQARLEEVRLRVLASGDRNDVAADTAASSTAAWLAHRTHVSPGQARHDVRLALALDTDLHETRAALARGSVDADQARVIVTAVQALPEQATTADPTLAGRAEKHLIDLAAAHDARTLKRLARHVLEVIDPDIADEALGRKLDADERAASAATSFEMHDNGNGTHSGRFTISSLRAAMLRKVLEALTSPTHHTPGPAGTQPSDGAAPRRARPELMGEAFGELIERLDPTRVPTAGGVNATIVVLIDYALLLTGLGTARLDTGEHISASLARRLACEAGVVPAVVRRLVDGRSVVLDMGRKRRLHTEAQRIALTIEQGGCTAESCTRPAAWCHAHHDVPWSAGGSTSVTNGRLLCPFHHAKAHSPHYEQSRLPDGRLAFHRRT